MQIDKDIELIKVSEACNLLKISKSTIHNLIKKGEITSYKVAPKIIRLDKKELLAQIEVHPATEKHKDEIIIKHKKEQPIIKRKQKTVKELLENF